MIDCVRDDDCPACHSGHPTCGHHSCHCSGRKLSINKSQMFSQFFIDNEFLPTLSGYQIFNIWLIYSLFCFKRCFFYETFVTQSICLFQELSLFFLFSMAHLLSFSRLTKVTYCYWSASTAIVRCALTLN